MTAQKKTIIKGAFLRVVGDSRREGINILIIIENRDGYRVQMRALSGEDFCISNPLIRSSVSFTGRESTVALTV